MRANRLLDILRNVTDGNSDDSQTLAEVRELPADVFNEIVAILADVLIADFQRHSGDAVASPGGSNREQ